jgi:hypothetical protein
MNVHAPTADKDDKEPEPVFDRFPRYHMKIFVRDFNARVGRGRGRKGGHFHSLKEQGKSLI